METEERKERHMSHTTCTTGTMGRKGEREWEKDRSSELKILAEMLLSHFSPFMWAHMQVSGIEGCRLWRQQLASFVLVELTGSRVLKLLQGMWFSWVDRQRFFFLSFFFSQRAGMLQAEWLGCTVKWSFLSWLAEVSRGLYVCVGDRLLSRNNGAH